MINKKYEILNKYSYNKNDTGSVEVQIILFSIKIDNLYIHLKKNPKDINNKINLKKKIEKRKRLIKYFIKKKNLISKLLLNELNLKKYI